MKQIQIRQGNDQPLTLVLTTLTGEVVDLRGVQNLSVTLLHNDCGGAFTPPYTISEEGAITLEFNAPEQKLGDYHLRIEGDLPDDSFSDGAQHIAYQMDYAVRIVPTGTPLAPNPYQPLSGILTALTRGERGEQGLQGEKGEPGESGALISKNNIFNVIEHTNGLNLDDIHNAFVNGAGGTDEGIKTVLSVVGRIYDKERFMQSLDVDFFSPVYSNLRKFLAKDWNNVDIEEELKDQAMSSVADFLLEKVRLYRSGTPNISGMASVLLTQVKEVKMLKSSVSELSRKIAELEKIR